jgi:hypothetical protein
MSVLPARMRVVGASALIFASAATVRGASNCWPLLS